MLAAQEMEQGLQLAAMAQIPFFPQSLQPVEVVVREIKLLQELEEMVVLGVAHL